VGSEGCTHPALRAPLLGGDFPCGKTTLPWMRMINELGGGWNLIDGQNS
jgi:hypothetical protein